MRGEEGTQGDGSGTTGERTHGRARANTRRLLTRGGRGAGLVVLVLVAVAAMALASSVYLTQTIPTTTAPGSKMSGCSALTDDVGASGNDTTQAWVVYNCGASPAFTTGAAGTYTPTFGSGSGETDIYIVAASAAGAPSGTPTTGCAQFGGAQALTSGSAPATFAAGSTWDYCLDAPVGGTISTFTVSWT